jgi:hypothetical protein
MPRRPGIITFIGVLMLLHAALSLVGGVVLVALRTQRRVIEQTNLTSEDLLVAGVVALVLGVIYLVVALLLLSGSRVARGLVAAVQILSVMAAAWTMFTHHSEAFLFQALFQVAIAIFVLWALFNERSEDYFNPAHAAV